MADLDLCVKKSMLSNFADDTQSIIVTDNKEETIEITIREANHVLNFFTCNNLVNNVEKAAVMYNSKGTIKKCDTGAGTLFINALYLKSYNYMSTGLLQKES